MATADGDDDDGGCGGGEGDGGDVCCALMKWCETVRRRAELNALRLTSAEKRSALAISPSALRRYGNINTTFRLRSVHD